jgi:hypothetical protein
MSAEHPLHKTQRQQVGGADASCLTEPRGVDNSRPPFLRWQASHQPRWVQSQADPPHSHCPTGTQTEAHLARAWPLPCCGLAVSDLGRAQGTEREWRRGRAGITTGATLSHRQYRQRTEGRAKQCPPRTRDPSSTPPTKGDFRKLPPPPRSMQLVPKAG